MNAVFYRDCTLVRATPDMIMCGGNYLIFRLQPFYKRRKSAQFWRDFRRFFLFPAAAAVVATRFIASNIAIHRVEYCDHRVADYLFDN